MKCKLVRRFGQLCAALVCVLAAQPALAFDEPPVNLGLTTFLDGAPPPGGPGWYYVNFSNYFSADKLRDQDGNKFGRIPFPDGKEGFSDQRVRVPVNIFQLIYLSDKKFLGGNLGFTTLLPVVLGAKTEDGRNEALLGSDDGVGDVIIGPLLQFQPITNGEGPVFSQRFEIDFVLPTGRFKEKNAVSPGVNFLQFNPYWAATYWIMPQWTVSWRLHYLWNARNKDAPDAVKGQANVEGSRIMRRLMGDDIKTVQAGQAVHANFASEYAVTDRLRLGVNGYWFQQIEDTEVDGTSVRGRRERVLAIGPGLLYTINPKNNLFINGYFENNVKNRPEGNRLVVRYIYQF